MTKLTPTIMLTIRRLAAVSFVFVLALSMFLSVASIAHASTLSEEFTGSSDIKPGFLVSTSTSESNDIELATLNNSEYLVGVVETKGSGLVEFSRGGTAIPVATSGVVAAYVSDANGAIKKGDFVGPSWVDGVGMVIAQGSNQKIIGTALEDFDTANAKTFDGIETSEETKSVKVGSIAVRLTDIQTQQKDVVDTSGFFGFISQLVGRKVSFVRSLLAFLVFVVAVGICAVFVYSSVKNSITAIGRNPMASKSIYRSLTQTLIVSVIIVLAGTAAAYALVVI